MTEQEEKIMNLVLKNEGGFQNNPKDPGNYLDGKLIGTNYGITPKTAKTAMSWGLLPKVDVITEEYMRAMQPEQAKKIYYHMYYKQGRSDQLPWPLAYIHTDSCVHHGVGSANRFFQRALNKLIKVYAHKGFTELKVDGLIGTQTLGTFQKLLAFIDVKVISKKYLDERNASFSNPNFIEGWNNRTKLIAKQTGLSE